MAKEKEVRPEDILRDLVAGRRSDVPEEGLPGVRIIYQSGPVRIHYSRTKGPTVITPERNVLIDAETEAGFLIDWVPYGYGPRTWRFPSPSDPPPRKKAAPPAPVKRERKPGNPVADFCGRTNKTDTFGGGPQQEDAETE